MVLAERTISVSDFGNVTLSIIEADGNRYFELTGQTESTSDGDKERIAHVVSVWLGIGHEEAYESVFGFPEDDEQ